MKPVKNKEVKPIKKIKPVRAYNYWCKSCGEPDMGRARYHETLYGGATLLDIEGHLDGYDSDYSDQFEIDHYECMSCGEEADHVEDLFTTDDPNSGENEED